MSTALIILGAGMGTRMNSELPKVLHQIGGAPMLVHAMRAGATLNPEKTVIVAGHGAEAVSKAMVRAWHQAGVESRSEVLAVQQSGSRWGDLPDQPQRPPEDA